MSPAVRDTAPMQTLRVRVGALRCHTSGGAVPGGRVVRGGGDTADASGGFVLLEEIVALSLMIIVMAALATFFLTATQSTNYQRSKQSAIQLANTEMDAIRAVRAGDLVYGRTPQLVSNQFATAPAAVLPLLSANAAAQASDLTATTSSVPTLPLQVAATANHIAYTISDYFVACSVTSGTGSTCANALTSPIPGVPYLRAVVSVTWAGSHCPNNQCTYVTSTLVSAQDDPTFALHQSTIPPMSVINPGDQRSVPNVPIAPLTIATTGVAPVTPWSATTLYPGASKPVDGLPPGLSISTSGVITGSPTAPGSYTVTITATDAFVRTATSPSFTWLVAAKPTITGLVTPFTAAAGIAIASQALPWTCSTGACTETLTGAPKGIGLSLSATGTPAASVNVTGSSGTVYLVGTVDPSAAPNPTAYSADVTSQGGGDYWRLGESSGSTGLDSIGNLPLTELAGVTHGVPGGVLSSPDGASAFDGSPVDGSASTTTAITAPTVFSESIWFRTTSTTGGKLLGFGNTQSGLSTGYDRHLYLDNAGHLDFGVYNNGAFVAASPGSYNDGAWHEAVGTLSGSGMVLYVDGAQVAANTATTTAGPYSGYWRLGGDRLDGWPNQPSSAYFAGALDDAAIYPTTALTAGQVSQQYADAGPAPYTVAVTPTDTTAGVPGVVDTAAWSVVPPGLPTVTNAATPFVTTAGAAITSQPLPYTCPTSSCTYTVSGAPPGIGITATSGGTPNPSVTVSSGTGGTLYLTGRTSSALAPSATAYAADVISQGATHYWRLDDTAAGVGVDSVTGSTAAPLTEQGGVGHGAPGGVLATNDTSSTFDGTPAGAASTTTAVAGPSVFTESVWFRTTTTAGGKLLGFGDQQSSAGLSNNYDRQVYMDNNGRLSFGTCPQSGTCPTVVVSPKSYNDGQWHQAVGSLSSAGLAFYVDGAVVGTDPTVVTAQNYAGYWRLGGDRLDGWNPPVSSPYFAGTLDDVSIYPTALTPAQVSQQYADSGRAAFTVLVTPKDLVSGSSGLAAAAAWSVDSPPSIAAPTSPFTTTTGAVLTAQPMPYSCPVASCTAVLTGAPAGIGLSATPTGPISASIPVTVASGTLYLRGTISAGARTGAYSLSAAVTDNASGITGPAATAAWTVNAAPTASGLTLGPSLTVGQVVGPTAVAYTCPTAACTLTLAGAPAGLGLSTTSGGPTSATVTVTATSGSVYVSGTIAATAATGPYTATVTPTDTPSGVVGSAATASGTLYAAPTVSGIRALNTTQGATIATQTLAYTCPDSSCTFSVNAPSGLGLATTTAGSPTPAASVTVGTGSGSVYLLGTISPSATPGTTTVTVTPTDAVTATSGAPISATWTVSRPPTITGLSPVTTTARATIATQSLLYTCPLGACTFTVTGVPGIVLSTSSLGTGGPAGTATGTTVAVTATSGTLYLLGTVDPSAAGSYTETATGRDTASGVTGTPATATWTVGPPTVTGLANLTTTVGATITSQALTYTCPTATCSYALTGAPSAVGLAKTTNGTPQAAVSVSDTGGTIYVVGTIGSAVIPGTFALAVTPTDTSSSTTGTATTATWTVRAKPTVTGVSPTLTTTVGATITQQALSYTCPTSTCSLALTGAPAGLGLTATSGAASGTATLTVGAPSGTVYLVGTISPSETPGTFAIAVTPTDTPSRVSGTPSTGSWTVRAQPTISGLGGFTATVGTKIATQSLAFNCPTASCTYTLSGGPAGVGLATDPAATSGSASVAVTATSGTVYLVGTPTAGGSGTLSVTPRDTVSGTAGPAATAVWTVYAAPTVTALTTPFTTTVGATINQTIGYTCPSSSCTFALTGAPAGIQLAANGGTPGLTVSVTGSTAGSLSVVGSPTVTGTFTLTVTPRDTASGVAGQATTSTWTVYPKPTVTGVTALTTTAGATITSQPLTYGCPTAACTLTVSGAPAGVGVAASSGGAAQPSIPLTAANGTAYLVGTIATSAAGTYTVTVTITDTASAVSGTPSTAAWTVRPAPTVTGLTNPFSTTVGTKITAQQLTTTCAAGAGGCSYTVTGAPTGVGLASTAAGAPQTTITPTASSPGLYVVGTPTTAGSFTVTVTPLESATNATGTPNTAAWTVYAQPTVTGLTNPFTTTAGVSINAQTLPFTCPTASCTYSLTGAPGGIGLATSSTATSGAASQPVTTTSGNLFLVGTVAGTTAPGPRAYAADVAAQGASDYWRLGEASGSTGADSGTGTPKLPLTEQAGVGHGAPGAITPDPDTAAPFDGQSADGSASTTTAITGPQLFSESIWFKTTTTSGGKMLGFGSSTTGASASYDRHLYLDNSGHVWFGVYPGTYSTVSTPNGGYNDGRWHQAIGTLSGAGQSLYVDGALIGTVTTTSAQAYSGYWRLGGDNLNTWPSAPTSYYFAGTLDDASIYPTALTPTQVAQQYTDSGRAPYTVTVTPTDTVSGTSGPVAQAAWTVLQPPTATGLTSPFRTTAGATITAQPLAYTCPGATAGSSPATCTVSLTGAPAGIGLSATSGGTPSGALSVSANSGTVYLVGTVASGAAANSPYTLTLTAKDDTSAVTGPATTSTWTVYPPPTVSGLPANFGTIPNNSTVQPIALSYTCPTATCSLVLTGAPSSVGLSTTTTGGTLAQTLPVGNASGTVYLRGVATPPGTYTISVTPTDLLTGVVGASTTTTGTVSR